MPMHAHALPISATNLVIKDRKGETYPLLLDTDTFDRTGEDGGIPILPLNGGDEFVGESLGGGWHKGWDSDIDTFTATISGGTLRMTGVAAVAGTAGDGWIKNYHPVPLLDDLEVTFNMEMPVDDTGAVVNRDIRFWLYLTQDKNENDPSTDDNRLDIQSFVDETGIIYSIEKRVNGAATEVLASGYNYTMDTTHSTGDLEATIWRLVFNGKPGTVGATMSVYLKQAATLALAESATENEVTGSPFDLSDLAFNIAYPSYRINTKNTTYFGTTYDSANRAASGYLRVSYPSQFALKYDETPADYGKGDVCLFDGDPDAGGVRVYDCDHTFAGDAYIQNGLIRLHIDENSNVGFNFLYYTGASWIEPFTDTACWLNGDSQTLNYVTLRSIEHVSPEKIILKIRWLDSSTINADFYLDSTITIMRGLYYIKITFTDVFPIQEFRLNYYKLTGGKYRFGYVGDNQIGDDDVNITGTNTTYTDNFMVAFDDTLEPVLMTYIGENYPTTSYNAADGGWLRKLQISPGTDLPITDYLGLSPFSNNSELFEEAEDATISASAREYIDATHDGFTDMSDMVTDAQPDGSETVIYEDDETFWTAGSNVVLSEELVIVKTGTSSLKIVVSGGNGDFYHDYGAGSGVDYSGKPYFGFWWYGSNSSAVIRFSLNDDGGGGAFGYHDFTDDFTGWKWICLKLSDFIDSGGVDYTDIRWIYFSSIDDGITAYLDHLSFYDGLWTETTNCTITINDETDPQEGTYNVKIVSNGAGVVVASVAPISPLGKLTKFDNIKWGQRSPDGMDILIRIRDTAGQSVRKGSNPTTGSMVQQILALPHSASDLQGWTDTGTFDYDDLVQIRIEWTASGAGEILYLDGLHEYIGTSTTRGRGETLSGSSAVVLDAQNEYVEYVPIAGTNLPEGRYLLAVRVKDTDQVADDFGLDIINSSDTEYRNQIGVQQEETLTAAFTYEGNFWFISTADVTGTDNIRLRVTKLLATENTMFVDYFLLIPIGDGMNWGQDLSHSVMRDIVQHPRICER